MTLPPSYNLTQINNVTSPFSFVSNVNTYLFKDLYIVGWIVALYLVLMLTYVRNNNDPGKAFIATSFITFILSWLAMLMELVPVWFVYTMLSITALSLISKRNS